MDDSVESALNRYGVCVCVCQNRTPKWWLPFVGIHLNGTVLAPCPSPKFDEGQ